MPVSDCPCATRHPTDVIKVRQQTAATSRNIFATGFNVVRQEGVLALYRGCTAAVVRGVLYGGECGRLGGERRVGGGGAGLYILVWRV